MKRKLMTLLVAFTLVGLIGCGGDNADNGDNTVTNSQQEDDQENDDGTSDESQADSNGDSASDATYATYDDLSLKGYVGLTAIEYYHPNWWYNSVVGGKFFSRDVNDFYIIVAYNEDTPYTGELDGILEQTYPEFIEMMKLEAMISREANLDVLTTEKVTIDNGIEAIKFEGIQPGYSEEYSDIPVFGYSFIYENVSMTFGYILDNDSAELKEEYQEEVEDVIYRMITTLHIVE